MVLLTMTGAMVDAILDHQQLDPTPADDVHPDEPSLDKPSIGRPISHGQVIVISRHLRSLDTPARSTSYHLDALLRGSTSYHLDALLRGCTVYTPPPPPPPEPTSDYTALMANLRRAQESIEYSRLLAAQPSHPSTLTNRLSATPHAHHTPLPALGAPEDDVEDDEATYADISRQTAVIVNVLVSIIACSVALWVVARQWSTPKRLGLSMGGSGLVAVAEVVVYSSYLRKVQEAKTRAKKGVERKEIVNTWVFGGDQTNDVGAGSLNRKGKANETTVRKRTGRKR